MSALILDGKVARDAIRMKLKERIKSFGISPRLIIFQVGNNPESDAYVKQKILFGTSVGVEVLHERIISDERSEGKLIERITECNLDDTIQGIIVQLPLGEVIDKEKVLFTINPRKDIDGLHPENVKLLALGTPRFIPATARGIFSLLDFYSISVEGENVVVIGRSDLVGKPTALLAQSRKAKVVVCHSKTENVPEITKRADIVIVATGKEGLVGRDHVSPGQVIIDVGIHQRIMGDKKIFSGDVKFDEVKEIVSAITPVPGGVGPMTVTSLFENLIDALEINKEVAP